MFSLKSCRITLFICDLFGKGKLGELGQEELKKKIDEFH